MVTLGAMVQHFIGVLNMGIRRDEVMIVNGRLKQLGVGFRVKRDAHRRAVFQCQCGVKFIAIMKNVKSGNTMSCGCFKREVDKYVKHGHATKAKRTPEYTAWHCMKSRCLDKRNADYASYGGRGIRVADSWLLFENFLRDMGIKPAGTSIDRIDNNGNYEPNNCRWATNRQQSRNKRTTINLMFNGKLTPMIDVAKELGITYRAMYFRLRRGWTPEQAISTPTRKI